MAKLEIRTVPDPILKAPCAPVEEITAEIVRLVEDMTETMYQAPGVGLAANQVGVAKQVIVVDASQPDEPTQAIALINPRIVAASKEVEKDEEGCLSVPELKAEIERALRVTVLARDIQGEDVEIEAEGFLARVLQHEIDHLNATTILDRIGKFKRERYLKQRKQAIKNEK